MKPVQPDDTLAKIVGSTPLPRSELTKKIWDYIKKNKLQDEKKGRSLMPTMPSRLFLAARSKLPCSR